VGIRKTPSTYVTIPMNFYKSLSLFLVHFVIKLSNRFFAILLVGVGMGTVMSVQSYAPLEISARIVQTLIITNSSKLEEFYGVDEAKKVMNKLDELAKHVRVNGSILDMAANQKVINLCDFYITRHNNAVAETIKQIILEHWIDSLENIVIIGDDRVIPFYRLKDDIVMPLGTRGDEWTLTDDFYLDKEPTNITKFDTNNNRDDIFCSKCTNSKAYIPDIAGGRLVENSSQIIDFIDAFLANEQLDISKAAITGYDFVKDGAEAQHTFLKSIGIDSSNLLINDNWTVDNFVNLISDKQPDIISINGHATSDYFSTPKGNKINALKFSSNSMNLLGKLVYTMGCHAGENVVDNSLDFPENFAKLKTNYIANTGYGWGGIFGIALSEKLMENLTKNLFQSDTTIGKALMNTKRQYFYSHSKFTPKHEKTVSESTLYGLPMYQITSKIMPEIPQASGDASMATGSTANQPINKEKDKSSYSYLLEEREKPSLGSGNFYSVNGETTEEDNKPILPKFIRDVSRSAKTLSGVVFKECQYIITDKVPPIQRLRTTTGYYSPAQLFRAPNWYPSIFFQSYTLQENATILVIAGQYNPNLGQQRIFDSMNFDVYYHQDDSDDFSPPEVSLISGSLSVDKNLAIVNITASDASGIKTVVVAYTSGKDSWNHEVLELDNNKQWLGTFAANENTEFFIQAVDGNGNVAYEHNEDKYFNFKNRIQFKGLNQLYNAGNKIDVKLVESPLVESRAEMVDLWFAIQLPSGEFLFVNKNGNFGTNTFKPFKESVSILEVKNNILRQFTIPNNIGGEYILYAFYVAEGQNPFEVNIEKIARSNLVKQTIILTD
jgi:hypothetical protein